MMLTLETINIEIFSLAIRLFFLSEKLHLKIKYMREMFVSQSEELSNWFSTSVLI